MKRLFAPLALVAWLATPAIAADNEAGMTAAANGFYGVYKTFHPSDGIPASVDRAKYAPFLTPALIDLLKQAEDAEIRFSKANKDSPPLVEGDLFTSMFEGATAVQVGACTGNDRQGVCEIKLEYANPGDKPIGWSDSLHLAKTPSGWADDISYGASWAFGNKGLLSDTLKQVIGFQ